MIAKERGIPIRILKLESLLKRLPANHSKRLRIEEDLAIAKAGFRGEQSIDYYLDFLPNLDYTFLHDLRLPIRQQFFQIDTLLLTPYYLLIIEMKNIAGTIYFDDVFQQMIRIVDEKEERFINPILQTDRQKLLLKEWLRLYGYLEAPIYTVAVFSNPKAIIKTSANNHRIAQNIIQIEQLPHYLTNLAQNQPTEIFKKKDIQKISFLLNKHHTFIESDILAWYQISENEIRKGIQCPKCHQFSMDRIKRKWECPSCQHRSKDAHILALKEYYFLIRSTITNKQLRDFLQVSGCRIASHLLYILNLPSSGPSKCRAYDLKPICSNNQLD
ncbi:ribosomal protein L37AE/L43A [Bacillus ectoiniformans]|uniref:nuclease-related domain-containing protein n=1 Tax=Bacillus ectoiniformans TaxID=1494429 RepID=UPI0019560168|nr:nuclease-related domain-containing protein [Bacillus ectoiniformans]MBM7650197.1 ribosomal protein L37AE/L43A [Bacillus ectoiniformans]